MGGVPYLFIDGQHRPGVSLLPCRCTWSVHSRIRVESYALTSKVILALTR